MAGKFFLPGLDKMGNRAIIDQTRPDQTSLLPKIPTVAVVMSTFNGEKYLAEQIDSILSQEGVNVELYIRDDGSSDGTRDIISHYVTHHRNIHARLGRNLGYKKSFVLELCSVPEFDYYAFSDQDDFWKPGKIRSALQIVRNKEKTEGRNIPVLYMSALELADKNLVPISTRRQDNRVMSIGSLTLRRTLGTGCTMLFNSRLRELVKSADVTELAELCNGHDALFVELTLITGGAAVYDPNSYILYRQHGQNTIGVPLTFRERIMTEAMRFRGHESEAARMFLELWDGEITPEARNILETVAGYHENLRSRLKIVFSLQFRTGDIRLSTFGKLKALLGLL